MATWKKGYDPNNLTHQIDAAKVNKADGSVVFNGMRIVEYEALLKSMLDLSDEIPEEVAKEWVTRAIFSSGRNGTITQKTFLDEFNLLEKNYLTLPMQRFVLVTSLSIRGVNLKSVKINGSILSFLTRPLMSYQISAAQLINDGSNRLFADVPTNYYPLRVFVSGRGIHEAANKALDQLDIVRGAWNWAINSTQPLRWSIGKPLPVNKIVLGPLHTLHFPNTKLAANNTWWYEPNYLGPVQLYDISQNIQRLTKTLSYVRLRIQKSPYGNDLKKGILRYTRALDERNWHTAYLKLWSALEFLTFTSNRRANHEDTISRTAFLFEEREYHLQVLNHLREYRNRFVHADKNNSEIETFMYQLKNYVEFVLGFHFKNRFGFSSLEEAAQFLDTPTKKSDLENQIIKLQNAQKFFGHKK